MNSKARTKQRIAAPKVRQCALALAAAGVVLSTPALAVKFEGESISGSFDSTISFGFQRRMESPDCSIIGNDNGGCAPTTGTLGVLVNGPDNGWTSNPDFNYLQSDNGNLNFKKGDIVSAAIKGTHELYLKYPAGWSSLVRATWSHDFKADATSRTPLSDDAKDLAVSNWTWLDYYLAKDFYIGDRPAKVKLGNQVVSWGEDVFIYGGVNVTNAVDFRKFHTPGTQLKEVLRPAEMLYLNTGVTDTISFEGYYQWKWNAFQFDPVGTFFSGADVIGKGAGNAYFPMSVASLFGCTGATGSIGDPGGRHGLTDAQLGDGAQNPCGFGTVVPRGATNTPPNSGQFGLAFRWKPDTIPAEFAFYHLQYHDKLPFIGFAVDGNPLNPLGVSYFEEYGRNKKLFGVSMNTRVGDVAVGAELSYRPNDSVGIDPTVPLSGPYALSGPGVVQHGYVEERKWQAHLTGFYLVAPSSPLGTVMSSLGASESYILAEAAAAIYPGLDLSGNIPYLLPNYELPNKVSWGYVVEIGLTYPNAFGSGWNMSPQLDFSHDVKGISPNTIPFVEGRKSATFALNFDHHNTWKANLGYSAFWGGGSNNLMRDRNFIYGSVSYSF